MEANADFKLEHNNIRHSKLYYKVIILYKRNKHINIHCEIIQIGKGPAGGSPRVANRDTANKIARPAVTTNKSARPR